MAILKTMSRLQREKVKLVKPSFVPLFNYDAQVQAYRDHLIANFTGNVSKVETKGGPLQCQKYYQKDYRCATPKGVVLLSAAVRGNHKRFAVN
jgi:hypothetical protein